jgi:hypothetical protein
MNEEKYIKDHVGKRTPFTVPDGYFDSVVDNVMKNLPTEVAPMKKMPTILQRVRPYLYMAACLIVAVFTITVYFNDHTENVQMQQLAVQESSVSTEWEDEEDYAMDYVMLDNYDIYACLTNE